VSDEKTDEPTVHHLSALAEQFGLDELYIGTIIESSNPGPVGLDTGYEFKDPKTGQTIRVLRRKGESRKHAIERVRKNHDL